MRARLLLATGLAGAVLAAGAGWLALRGGEGAAPAQRAAILALAETWDGEIAFESSYDALVPAAAATGAGGQAAPRFNPADAFAGLPRTGAYELVAGYCSACHSLQLVMQQQASPARWSALLDAMIEVHGMAAPPAEDRRAIEAYLGEQFGERQNLSSRER